VGRNSRWTEDQIREKFLSVGLELGAPVGPHLGTRTKWNARCTSCGELTKRSLSSLLTTGTDIGCQSCSIKERSAKSRLSDQEARQFLNLLGLNPLVQYPGSQVPWEAECVTCGQKVSRTYSALKDAVKIWGITQGCQYCNGTRIIDAEMNEILTKFGLIPVEDYVSNSLPRLFTCAKCGAETRQTYINIRRKLRSGALSFGCPKCSFDESGRRRAETEENAILRFNEVGLRMIGKYVNARKSIECECLKCGAITKQTLNGVKNGKTCKFCAVRGIQHGEPAYLYIVQNEFHGSLKVGIGNIGNKNDRLLSHHRQGWSLVRKWEFATGQEAEILETAVFRWIRYEKRIPIHLSKGEMPQGGWSETLSQDAIPLEELIAKIEVLRNLFI